MSRDRAHQCLLQYSVQMAHYRSGHCCPLAFPLHILHLQRKAKGWKSVFAELFQGVGSWEGAATFLQVALATSQLLHVYLISLVLPGRRLTSTSVFYRASVVFSLPVGMPLLFFYSFFVCLTGHCLLFYAFWKPCLSHSADAKHAHNICHFTPSGIFLTYLKMETPLVSYHPVLPEPNGVTRVLCC